MIQKVELRNIVKSKRREKRVCFDTYEPSTVSAFVLSVRFLSFLFQLTEHTMLVSSVQYSDPELPLCHLMLITSSDTGSHLQSWHEAYETGLLPPSYR